jgi:F-type H+-transporting ATPase subunit b
MITIDVTLIVHLLIMLTMMFVLNTILYKPILAILKKRQEKIDGLNNDAEQFEENARHRQAEVDKKMHEASMKAKKALDGARSEAQAVGAEKIAAIREEAEGEKEKQLSALRAEIQTARKELQDNTAGFAQEMAAKILGRSLEA